MISLFSQQLLEEPLGEFLLDLLNRLSFLASGFRRNAFAFLFFAFRLFCLLLLSPLSNLLPPADVTERPQPDDHQDRHGDEPASQPAAVDGHLLVNLLELIGEPFHLELQAADLLVELLDRGRGVVILAGRHQALAMGRLQLLKLGWLRAHAGRPGTRRR